MMATEMLATPRLRKDKRLKKLEFHLDPNLRDFGQDRRIFAKEPSSPQDAEIFAKAPPQRPPTPSARRAHLTPAARGPVRYWSGATGSTETRLPVHV